MSTLAPGAGPRNWSIDELRVLAAIFFNSSFSIGDDQRDECRAIADSFGRTPSSIDRQWRNMAAIVKGDRSYNVGGLVKRAVADYLANPAGSRLLAISICQHNEWPVVMLITHGKQEPLGDAAPTGLLEEAQRGLQALIEQLEFRMFASGSQGFYRQGKVTAHGSRYQAQVTAVLIGSRNDMTVTVQATRGELALAIKPVVDHLGAKTFRTGRVGFYANGKVAVASERYQVSMQAVRIGDR